MCTLLPFALSVVSAKSKGENTISLNCAGKFGARREEECTDAAESASGYEVKKGDPGLRLAFRLGRGQAGAMRALRKRGEQTFLPQ